MILPKSLLAIPRLLLCLALFAVALSAGAQALSGNDLVFGTWELVLDESVFLEREAPARETRTYTPHPDGVETRLVTVSRSGVTSERYYVGAEDGVPHPTYGTVNSDGIILQRTGPYTAITTFTHAGREVGDAKRVISQDGSKMTVSVTLNGNLVSRSVYRKVTGAGR